MEHRWNDTDRGKLKYWEKNVSNCHFVHQKYLVSNPGRRGERPAIDRLSHGTAKRLKFI
jgi:hypothetical protein